MSVKCLRFKDISSRFQVFYEKAIQISFTKFIEKQSYRSLFSDRVSGLKLKERLADYYWATISAKCSLYSLRRPQPQNVTLELVSSLIKIPLL